MKKKHFVTGFATALLCIVMLAGFANANPTTVSSATAYSINGGSCGSLYITSPYDAFVIISGPTAYSGVQVVCDMSATVSSGSTIAIYAKSMSADLTNNLIYVYTADSANGPWTLANYPAGYSNPAVVSTTSWTWYYFTAPSNCEYIAFAVYAPNPVGVGVDYLGTM